MNKHLFRVIFNKARGIRMVVQETAASGGGQGSDAATRSGGAGRGFAPAPLAAALALLLVSAAGLAQIRTDRAAPGGQRPTVLNSANGTPTVNIQTPSAAGVSRNSYSQFDIGGKGAILNNSRTAVQSRIGGWIQGNGALARGSARVIVNEVNASAASQLMGALEVAGQRADVIVANPSGLVVDGLSLINAAGVTLTTGRPLYGAGGSVEGFSVQNGLIHTQGLGLDATAADYAHILARAVSLNAGVWAQDLRVVMGANEIAVDGRLRGVRAGTAERPQFALDVAQLGGMYAGRIFIVGTEAGLGVRNAGALAATRAALTLSADGQLQNTGAMASNGTGADLDISAQGIANSGTLTSQQDLRLADGGGTTINSGILQAQRQLVAKFGHLGNQPLGVIGAQRLEITAATLNNAGSMTQTGMQALDISSATLSSSGDQAVVGARAASALPAAAGQGPAGTVPGQMPAKPMTAPSTAQEGSQIHTMPAAPLVLAPGRVEVAQHMDNTGALLANGATDLHTTQELVNSGSMQLRQLYSEGLLDNSQGTLHAQQLRGTHHTVVNRAGALYVASDLRLVAERIDNTGGTVGSAQALTARVQGRIANDGGTLGAARDLSLTARELQNNDQARIVSNTGSVQLEISQTLNNRQGQITTACADSTANIKIEAANLDSTQGAVLHNGSGQLDIRVSEALGSDQAQMLSNGSANVTAGRLSNDGGAILALQELAISARAGLSNVAGRLVASKGKLQLQAGGPVDNRGGHMLARGDLQAMVGDIDNTDGTMATTGALQLHSDAHILNTRGQLQAQGAVDIQAVLLLNNQSGKLSSGADGMRLDAPTIDNRQGQIHSAQDASLRTLQLDNRQGTIAQLSAGQLGIDAANELNNAGGSLVSHGGLQLAAGETFNTGGEIVSQRDASLQVARLDSTQGLVQAGGKLDLRSDADINNHRGRILARGALNVTAAAALINTEGRLQSLGVAAVTSGALDNSAGTVSSMQAMLLDTGVLTNAGGTLAASQALELHSSALDNTQGRIGASSIAIATREGLLTNDNGKIIASQGNVNLQTGPLHSDGGVVQAAEHLVINTHGQTLTNTGTLLALGHATIDAAHLNNTTGTISAAEALTLTSTSLDNTVGKIGAESIAITTRQGLLTNDNGKIIASQGDVSLQTGALHSHLGLVQAAQHLDIDTHGQALTNTGTLLALGNATIDAGIVDNTGGTISAADALTLTSTSLDNTSGQICAASIAINTQRGTLINKASGKIIASNGELNVQSGALNNDQGLLQAAQALTVNTHGHGIANTNTGTLRGFHANIDAGPVNNAGGGIAAATTLDFKSSALDNRAGRINAASAAIDTRKGTLHNDAGHIVTSTGTLDVKSGVFHNGSGMVHAAQDLEIRTNDEALNNSGTMRAQGNARIRAGTLDNTGGNLLAGGPDTADAVLSVTATGHVNNSAGHMLARGNLTLTAPALNNSQGEIGAGGKLDARIAAAVINSGGQLVGDAEAVLNSASLQNDEQAVISSSAGPVNVTTGALSNSRSSITARHATSISSQGLDNTQGTISGDSLTIDTQGQQLINADAKLLASGSSLRIDSGHLDNRRGRISAQQDAVLTAQGIHNGAGRISAPTLQVRSQDASGGWTMVDNQAGSMLADRHLQVDSGALNNTAGAIKTTRADSRLMLDGHGADITNHQSGEDGGILSAGALEVNAHHGMVRNSRGGIMGAAGDAEIKAERIENQGGVMASHSRLQITSNANTGTGIDNSEGGLLQSLGDVRLYAGDAAIMNTRGSIRANNGVLVQSRGHVENALGNIKAGKQLSILDAHVASGAPLSSAQQTLHNRGGTLSSGNDLAIRTKEFSGASGLQSQGDMQLEIAADHTNQGDMDIGGHLGITLGGNLANQGVIRGGKGVAVSASNIDNQSGAEISSAGLMKVNAHQVLTNRGVVTGGDAQINARVLDNAGEGLIVGDHLSIAADRIDNRAEGEKSGSIMARKLLEIGAAVVKNQHGASIRSDGDIRIGSILDENRVASGASSVSNHGALIDARGSVDFFSGAVHNTNAGVKVVKDEFVGSYPAGNLVQVEGRMPESDDQYQVHPHGILIPFYSAKQRIGELGFPEGMSAGGMFKITHPGRFLKNIPLACTPVKVANNYDDSYHLKYVYESANSMRFAEYGIEKPGNYNPIEPLPGNFGATLNGKEVYWGPSSNMAGFEAALAVYEKSVQAAKNLNNVILEKIKNDNKVEGFWRDYKKIVNVRREIFRDRVESSRPAKINAGRNITAVGEFYNVDSTVVANGVVFIPHQNNHSTKGVETTKTIGSPISYHWKSKRGGKVKQGSKRHYEVATPGQPTEQLSRITFDLPTGIYQQGHIGSATTSYAIPTKNAGKNTAFGRVEASPVVRISQGSESAAAEQGSAATKMGSLVPHGLPWADVDPHFHSPGVNVQPAQTAHPVPVGQPPQIGQSASPSRPQSASDLPIGTGGMTSVAAANIIHSGFTGTARMDVNGQELSGVSFLDVQPHSVHVAAEHVVPTPATPATQVAGGAMASSIGVPVADGMLLPPAQGIDATAHQMPNIAMAAPAFPEMSARAPAEVSEPAVTAAAGTALEVRTTALPQYLPPDSLYIINAHDHDKPLIETHPAVTNRKSWMSSDYMLDALSMDPALLQKRLGDGYYEQQLIQQQVGQLTGRRYLGHYTNDDEQYHALLQNGVTVAQDYKLRPGIALNAEQVAQLTSDLVWLVHEDITLSDGTVQTVLVPKVYVVAKVGELETSGALISGDTVYSQSRENFHNSGTIAGRRAVVIEANDINNIGGRIVGESVALLAERDINVVGGTVSAALSLMAKAGNDMNMATTTSTNRGGDDANGYANTNVDRIAALILEPVDAVDVPPAQRSLVLEAGRNANLQAALIANAVEGASTYIHAAKDVVLSTVNISNEQRITWDPRNLLSFGQSEEMGTEIQTLGPTRIEAGENFDARAAQVHSSKALEIKAVQDAKIAAGEASQSVDSRSYSKSKGLFSSSTSTRINQHDSTESLASSLSGDTVSITSHQDISVLGSNVGSQHGTKFKAERDINILADSETTAETNFHKTTKSGLIGGGGPGLTFGSQRQSTDRTGASITSAASTVASIDGDVVFEAGRHYRQVGSELSANESEIDVEAQDIKIVETRESVENEQHMQFRQGGLSIGISSPLISAMQTASQMAQASRKTDSTRMQALAAANIGFAGHQAMNAVRQGQGSTMNGKENQVATGNKNADGTNETRDTTAAEKAGGINFALSLGSSKKSVHGIQSQHHAKGSKLAAKTIDLKASGAGKASNVTLQGVDVQATERIVLDAENKINLLAAKNTAVQHSNNSGRSGNIGVSFGTDGLMFTASASGERGNADGSDVNWLHTHLNARQQVVLKSGADTTAHGASVNAEQITAKVGGKLDIKSLQDTSIYDSKKKSLGASISVGYGKVGGSVELALSKINSEYASVAEQSGFNAGNGGFDIDVAEETILDGGAITSTQEAVEQKKNAFKSACNVTATDIQNHAHYKAQGVSGSAGMAPRKKGLQPTGSAGIGYKSSNVTSTTYAGISGFAGKDNIRTGDAEAGVINSFNAQQVRDEIDARLEITKQAGKNMGTAIGDHAQEKKEAAAVLFSQANEVEERNPQLAEKLRQEVIQIYSDWGDGGAWRIGAHMFASALTGGLGGAAGALAATVATPNVADALEQAGIEGTVANVLTVAAGTVAGKVIGGSAGSASGLNEVVNNYLGHQSVKILKDCLSGNTCKTDNEKNIAIQHAEELSRNIDEQMKKICEKNPVGEACRNAVNAATQYVAMQDAWIFLRQDVARSSGNLFDHIYNSGTAKQSIGLYYRGIDQRANFFTASDFYEKNIGAGARWFEGADFVSRAPLTGLGADNNLSYVTFGLGRLFAPVYDWRAAAGNVLMENGFDNFRNLYNNKNQHPVAWDINQLKMEQEVLQPVHEKYLSKSNFFTWTTRKITQPWNFIIDEKQRVEGGVDILDIKSRIRYGCKLLGYSEEQGCKP